MQRGQGSFRAALLAVVLALVGAQPAEAVGPWNEAGNCVDTTKTGTLVTPPAGATYEIMATSGVPVSFAQSIQAQLTSHNVQSILHAGLNSQPRNHPARIRMYLTPGPFDSDGDLGVMNPTCQNAALDGLVVRADKSLKTVSETAAHELFHAYSIGGIAGGMGGDPWWEEAAATWSQALMGFGEDRGYDNALRYPNRAIDEEGGSRAYAMSRFLQFLEDRGFMTSGAAWPFARSIPLGYVTPGATQALANQLAAAGTTLGVQVAAFWGDRLKLNPAHGPRLVPRNDNSSLIEIEPGTTEVPIPVKRLHTKLLRMKLSDDVTRVEFEFEPKDDSYFWGLVKPNTVRQFEKGDSVSFCVGGSDQDDLSWPGDFPVTFTNGKLAGEVDGTITIHAQKSASQCTGFAFNEACQVLQAANVEAVFPGGLFAFFSGDTGERKDVWSCAWAREEDGAGAFERLIRFKRKTAREVRQQVRRTIEGGTFDPVRVGDVGGIRTETFDGKTQSILIFAVGRKISFLQVSGGRAAGISFGKKVAREM